MENAGTSKCFILVSFQLHKCISEKKKRYLELIGTVFQVKILINLQIFELFENANLSKVIALYYF